MDPTPWTLTVQNLRALKHIQWSPQGVCLLVGPNGSGKTTLLAALRFLHTLYELGFSTSLAELGIYALKARSAPASAPVTLSLQVGDVTWTVDVIFEGVGVLSLYGERLTHGAETVFEAPPRSTQWRLGGVIRDRDPEDRRAFLKLFWEQRAHNLPWLQPLRALVTGFRAYRVFQPDEARQPPHEASLDIDALQPSAKNLWPVLSRWKAAPRLSGGAFAWVLREIRAAFPEILEDLEFSDHVTSPRVVFYPPGARGADDFLPIHLAPDGLLQGLLLLTAAASAKPGSVLAFDELENHLHPYAIRSILRALRARAESHNLTIALTSHSPVVLSEFKGYEPQFFLLDPEFSPLPIALCDAYDPTWLAHFPLGNLYDRGEIAPPPRRVPSAGHGADLHADLHADPTRPTPQG